MQLNNSNDPPKDSVMSWSVSAVCITSNVVNSIAQGQKSSGKIKIRLIQDQKG